MLWHLRTVLATPCLAGTRSSGSPLLLSTSPRFKLNVRSTSRYCVLLTMSRVVLSSNSPAVLSVTSESFRKRYNAESFSLPVHRARTTSGSRPQKGT